MGTLALQWTITANLKMQNKPLIWNFQKQSLDRNAYVARIRFALLLRRAFRSTNGKTFAGKVFKNCVKNLAELLLEVEDEEGAPVVVDVGAVLLTHRFVDVIHRLEVVHLLAVTEREVATWSSGDECRTKFERQNDRNENVNFNFVCHFFEFVLFR